MACHNRAMIDVQDSRGAAYAAADALAAWSDWLPFGGAARRIERLPGVYSMRVGASIVYVGMASERAGSGRRRPEGMQGRLSRYTSGKAATSGLGEAALHRALADVGFVRQQLSALTDGRPHRVTRWAKDAIEWHNVEQRWTICADGPAARQLESQVVQLLRPHGLWNR